MSKNKFKVGDKVKYVSGANEIFFTKGQILTIETIYDNDTTLRFNETSYVCYNHEVKLFKPVSNRIKKL